MHERALRYVRRIVSSALCLAGAVLVVVRAAGCGGDKHHGCMAVGDPGALARRATLMRLDVYGAGARCDGPRLAPGAPAPLTSHSFRPGESPTVALAPGPATVVLTAFGDPAGTIPIGTGCDQATLAPGASTCLTLELAPWTPPDAGADACATDGGCPCVSDDDCPRPAAPRCAPDHRCVACLSGADCPAGSFACCGDQCVDTSADTANCGGCARACSVGLSCCAGACTDLATDPLHCGACGQACDTLHSVGASCVGASCQYAGCTAGWLDCDAAGTNVDGCECPTPGCCGAACQSTHHDGLGHTYYDCVAAGTYDREQATEACAAFTGDATLCHAATACNPTKTVCSDGGPSCACWSWSGPVSGHVEDSGQPAPACPCPSANSPTWD
jgi:hypothetical protein